MLAPNEGKRLPIEPLRAFVERVLLEEGMSTGIVCGLTGVNQRALYRVRYQHENVTLSIADQLITRLGGHLYEIYPDLQED